MNRDESLISWTEFLTRGPQKETIAVTTVDQLPALVQKLFQELDAIKIPESVNIAAEQSGDLQTKVESWLQKQKDKVSRKGRLIASYSYELPCI